MLAGIKRGLWLLGIAGLLGAESDSGGSDSDSGGSDGSDSGDSSGGSDSGGDDGGSSDSDSALSGDEHGAHEPGNALYYTSMHSNSDSTYSSTGDTTRRTPSKRKNDLSDDDLSEIPPQ